MSPDSTSAAKKTYRAGDTITAKLTLKPGRDIPQQTSATFTLTPPPQTWDMNRTASFNIGNWGMPSMPGAATANSNIITLTGQIPHHIVGAPHRGGTYKPTSIAFTIPNEPNQFDNNPDPDGDFVLQVEDDKPKPVDALVVEDFDLA